MKISKARLKTIILEELNVMGEMFYDDDDDYNEEEEEEEGKGEEGEEYQSNEDYAVEAVKTFFKDRPDASGWKPPEILKNAVKDFTAPPLLTMDQLMASNLIPIHPESGTPLLFVALKRAAKGNADKNVILSLLKLFLDYNPTTQMENKQMKITKARLKTIILEELTRVMREQEFGGETGKSTKIYIPQDVGETSITNLPYDQFDDRGIQFDDAFEEATKEAVDLFLGSYGGELGQDEEGDYITIYNPNPRINYGFKLDKMIKDALLEK